MSADLAALGVNELAPLLESREISPVEVTEAVLQNVARYDETLRAYIEVYQEDALARAHGAESEISAGDYRGPLHGVPLGIKDNIYFADRVTTMGSKIHGDFVSPHNAAVVDRLAAAGAVFLGKLNMHEYALGATTDNRYYGTCRNPWDLDKSPGGSSGGSGAAVAAHLATAALGSDTSGSIRIPSSFCGVVGLKPTYGRVSRFGVFPEAWTLDHVGPMTRSVKDAAILLDAMSGYDPRDPGSLNRPATRTAEALRSTCEGLTVGVVEDFYFSDVDDEVARQVRNGIEALRQSGAEIRPLSIPGLKDTEYALTIIDTSETSTVHRANLRDRREDYSDDVRMLLECGELPSAVDYLEAQQIRRHLRAEVRAAFESVDVIVGPTLPIRTPTIGEATAKLNGRDVDALENLIRLVGPASLLGLPTLSVPCGLVDGLPVGMQIVGPAGGEQKVLDAGNAFESTSPLASARPTAYLTD
jgi:aspartyl-tRNA(Asn)/glutamyl-tRNA(Gln) amidotransferase subunit A